MAAWCTGCSRDSGWVGIEHDAARHNSVTARWASGRALVLPISGPVIDGRVLAWCPLMSAGAHPEARSAVCGSCGCKAVFVLCSVANKRAFYEEQFAPATHCL